MAHLSVIYVLVFAIICPFFFDSTVAVERKTEITLSPPRLVFHQAWPEVTNIHFYVWLKSSGDEYSCQLDILDSVVS